MYIKNETIRKQKFSTCPEDRPLFVQWCASDPEKLKRAAEYLLENGDVCDAFDLNLGCPQNCAKKGNYGSFLLEQPDIIISLIRVLLDNFNIPVTCKIRCLRTEEETLDLVKRIEEAGCSILTVHGRIKEHNKDLMGPANWDIIKKIKESVSIPVFANGGIRTMQDVQECFEYTGVDGVMSSEAILENPAFFDSNFYHMEDLMLEYIDLAEKYEENYCTVRSHLYKSLFSGFKEHVDLRDDLYKVESYDEMRQVCMELKERRLDIAPEDKIEWYHRYWKGHETERAHTKIEYADFMADFKKKEISLDNNRKQFETQKNYNSKITAVKDLFVEDDDY
jgi:tRNA-dihydrouridine synthase 1